MYLVCDLRALRRLRGLRKEDESDREDQQDRDNESLKRSHGVWLGKASIGVWCLYDKLKVPECLGGPF